MFAYTGCCALKHECQDTAAHMNTNTHPLSPLCSFSLLFWVDQSPRSKVERCNLDGSNRTVIINSTGVINDIIVDYSSNKLFWVNNENHEFHTSDLDGANQRIFIPRPTNPSQLYLEQPFGMAKLGNQTFWTEWQTRSLYRALQTRQNSFLLRTITSFNYQRPNNIVVVNPLRPGGRCLYLLYSGREQHLVEVRGNGPHSFHSLPSCILHYIPFLPVSK